MKLYYSPGACSLAPHITAREFGLDLDLCKVDLKSKTLESGGDYRAINPKGSVPTLKLDDGQVLTENAVVLQFLAEKAGDRDAGMAHWRLLERLNFIATELHKGFGPLFAADTPEATRRAATQTLHEKFDLLSQMIGEGPLMMGHDFTVADAYAFAVLNWSGKFDIDLSRWPPLQAFMERMRARPSVQQAMAEEGLR